MTGFAVPSMLTQEEAVEIRVMARRGEGVRSIAKQLSCSRNTVRRYLRDGEACRYGPRLARPCKLDEYKDYLSERIAQARPRWIPATVLLREVAERGYVGGISQLKAWLGPMKRTEPEPVVRFETPPGKQMQADFTHVRRGRDPLIALVATMGYSRATFVKFAAREDAGTLCTGLREAFDYFGGVPEHVLFDNTKAVVIERDAYGPGLHRWNDELKALAEACGFTPRLCRPYRAKTKGKVAVGGRLRRRPDDDSGHARSAPSSRTHRADLGRELPAQGQAQGGASSQASRAGAMNAAAPAQPLRAPPYAAEPEQHNGPGWVRFTSAIGMESGSVLCRR